MTWRQRLEITMIAFSPTARMFWEIDQAIARYNSTVMAIVGAAKKEVDAPRKSCST